MATELIRIPVERADQLRALAARRSTTVTNVIGELVSNEIKRLGIVREIGIGRLADVTTLESGEIALSMSSLGNFTWTKADAVSVAETLDQFASPDRLQAIFDQDVELEFSRKGNGVIIRNVVTGDMVSMATPIAADFSALLRAHAA